METGRLRFRREGNLVIACPTSSRRRLCAVYREGKLAEVIRPGIRNCIQNPAISRTVAFTLRCGLGDLSALDGSLALCRLPLPSFPEYAGKRMLQRSTKSRNEADNPWFAQDDEWIATPFGFHFQRQRRVESLDGAAPGVWRAPSNDGSKPPMTTFVSCHGVWHSKS